MFFSAVHFAYDGQKELFTNLDFGIDMESRSKSFTTSLHIFLIVYLPRMNLLWLDASINLNEWSYRIYVYSCITSTCYLCFICSCHRRSKRSWKRYVPQVTNSRSWTGKYISIFSVSAFLSIILTPMWLRQIWRENRAKCRFAFHRYSQQHKKGEN